jgi:hypothetical protein
MVDKFLLMSTFKQVKENQSSRLRREQALFGLTFGIGICFTGSCSLSRRKLSVEITQQIAPSDTLNIVPFEDDCREVVRQGGYF